MLNNMFLNQCFSSVRISYLGWFKMPVVEDQADGIFVNYTKRGSKAIKQPLHSCYMQTGKDKGGATESYLCLQRNSV